jgi:hypothetical protein
MEVKGGGVSLFFQTVPPEASAEEQAREQAEHERRLALKRKRRETPMGQPSAEPLDLTKDFIV